MYVKRCGFYVQDKQLYRKDVWIEWDMEMPKENRYIYIGKIKDALGFELNPIVDTTTASPNYLGKKLNTYWNKIDGKPMIEVYNEYKTKYDPEEEIPGVFEFMYYFALDQSNMSFIKQMKCFTNMFYNPDKSKTCEALSCALLKLLISQNKLSYLRDLQTLTYWVYCNTDCMNVIHAGPRPVEPVLSTPDSYLSTDGFMDIPDYDDELPFA